MKQQITLTESQLRQMIQEAVSEELDEYGEWNGFKHALGRLGDTYNLSRKSGNGILKSLGNTAKYTPDNYRTGKYTAQMNADPREYKTLQSDIDNFRKQDSRNQKMINNFRFSNGANGAQKPYDGKFQKDTNALRFGAKKAQQDIDAKQAQRRGMQGMELRPTGTDGSAIPTPTHLGGTNKQNGVRGMENSPYRSFRDNNRASRFDGRFGSQKSARRGKFNGLLRESEQKQQIVINEEQLKNIILNSLNEILK